ncbi:hypothetical protein BDA96_10G013600 [Sorghum bicolor]|uniref:Uncharacterized protein n=1 Tax=Sorghum bicolor TaxID=4558 RepID=A0A921TXM7_SORBI|nr:hypothetical protein BDA96_10G013600 [Sorghum bicolor]
MAVLSDPVVGAAPRHDLQCPHGGIASRAPVRPRLPRQRASGHGGALLGRVGAGPSVQCRPYPWSFALPTQQQDPAKWSLASYSDPAKWSTVAHVRLRRSAPPAPIHWRAQSRICIDFVSK